MTARPTFVPALLLASVLLVSCAPPQAPVLVKDELFRLEYGKLEDQVELFLDGTAVTRKTGIAMRGGLFLISTGYGNRVMEFTSYGDLLTLHYNPDQNPSPVLLQADASPTRVASRRAYAHPFNAVGEIAVGDGFFLVEDQVPDRIAVLDDDLGVRLNRVVVRFDSHGNQIDYLGQEGIGGSFFPFIQKIDVTSAGDIVVVTAAPPRSIVFWYNSEGELLRRVEISPETLPAPSDVSAVPILESVVPDRQLRRLYLKVNFYLENPGLRRASSTRSDGLMSRIYWIDISDGTYEGFVDVPRNIRRDRLLGVLGETEEFRYELIGAAPGEHLFLLSRESIDQSQLMILHTSGKVVRRRTLDIDYREVILQELHLSETGILSALLAKTDHVEVVWWRTDRLLEAGR